MNAVMIRQYVSDQLHGVDAAQYGRTFDELVEIACSRINADTTDFDVYELIKDLAV